ncbi:phage integrase SAM-like domain-containing protein [Gillisia sp. Hel_I_29]|uniref:phage integrase SAM-like domain-containing protein n=1 Tax=Gillisia sp. Hel_I_29 TaxID=1249975 RepID=UPI0005571265|nr:phage integrase SAM-like domain-containing protein [Gillisia sp. Hel_I_29]
MATITYLIKGKKDPATIYVRFRHGRRFDISKSTQKTISPVDWSSVKKSPHLRNPHLRNLDVKLQNLSIKIKEGFNESNVDDIDDEWLEKIIKTFNNDSNPTNSESDNVISDLLIDNIQHIIDTANSRENSKGGLGLSNSRINSYKNLKRIINEYQGKKKIKVSEIDINFGRKFLGWMLNEKKYAESYARKKVDDIKTVCNDAQIQGLKISPQLRKVKGGKSKSKYIIYLSPQELEKIKNHTYEKSYLKNARKWLLLGCNIGQRGGDLLNLTQDNFVKRNRLEVIELQQQKTGKQITIPILPTTKEILKEGLPHKISMQNFNTYIKEVCEEAKINELIEGSMIPKKENEKVNHQDKRKVEGTYEKWKLITSHVCRRSFATNQYGILPTPLIMQITGHSTEKMFQNYIGKTSYDYAEQIDQFYRNQNQEK